MKTHWLCLGLFILMVGCHTDNLAADVQVLPETEVWEQPEPKTNSQSTIKAESWRQAMSANPISAEIEPQPNQANQAALALQNLGFRILHIGPTISVQAPQELWESTFGVSFQSETKDVLPQMSTGQVPYSRAVTDNLQIPNQLQNLISGVMFVEPPTFF